MTALDVKIPRWFAVALFAFLVMREVESAITSAINAQANLIYISNANNGIQPPPPFPGPETVQPPAKEAVLEQDGEKQHRLQSQRRQGRRNKGWASMLPQVQMPRVQRRNRETMARNRDRS